MNDLIELFHYIIIFIIFYSLLYIPQRRRNKKHKEILNNLKIGDNVITESGIHGRITNIDVHKVTLVLKKGEIVINKTFVQNKL